MINCKSSMNFFYSQMANWELINNNEFPLISTHFISFKLKLTLSVCKERLLINLAGICLHKYTASWFAVNISSLKN